MTSTTPQKPAILVVEDEADVRDLIVIHLQRMGCQVSDFVSAEEGLQCFNEPGRQFDLAIVDWMLPGMSGIELTNRIHNKVLVLMITARAAQEDVVEGLEQGADDYITKPFELNILQARVQALLRRSRLLKQKPSDGSSALIRFGKLVVDTAGHEARLGDQVLGLTPYEFKILASLLQNRGKALSRQQLIDLVQGEGVTVIDRTIDTHVFGLRKKLGDLADAIETIRGIGYRISIEE